jgi:hypothetical protein
VFHPIPDVFPMQPGDVTLADFLTSVAGGLLLANSVSLQRRSLLSRVLQTTGAIQFS